MSDNLYSFKNNNLECNEDGLGTLLVFLDDNAESFYDVVRILKEKPNSNMTIKNIKSYKTYNILISLLAGLKHNGIVTLDLLYRDNGVDDIERYEILDLFNIPSFVKISGFDRNGMQTSFTTWAHNQAGEFKNTLSRHLTDDSREAFESQEAVIKDFDERFGNKKISLLGDSKVMLDHICAYIKSNITMDRDLALDSFTGGIAKYECSWAENPTEVYKKKRGTSDGIAELITLLANNSKYSINCVTVKGELANGCYHEWNELVDENGNILHYDLAFNIEGMPEDKLNDRTVREEYSWVRDLRDDSEDTLPPSVHTYSLVKAAKKGKKQEQK